MPDYGSGGPGWHNKIDIFESLCLILRGIAEDYILELNRYSPLIFIRLNVT